MIRIKFHTKVKFEFSDVVEEEKQIMTQLEGIVCQAIAHVLQNRIMDYYEEVLSLLYSVTCTQISEPVWNALHLIFEVIFISLDLVKTGLRILVFLENWFL